MSKRLTRLVSILLTLAGIAAAQPVITDVVNAASRIPSGYPSYGIAQGALFSIMGSGLGPDQFQQASFPLPTTAGINGVTVQVKIGGTTVDAILVYEGAAEVAAILPSSTPTGTGTVTINNNGASTTAPITVVASAFGIFSQAYQASFTQYASSGGGAAAFNVNADGSTTLNNPIFPAQPGQTMMLNGTGLGAIQSDETQPGAADVPNAQITVYVGNQQATVLSAGRGTCCSGLPPAFPVPQGIAAWDVIQFTVPDANFGCLVSVVVQSGNYISNPLTISISPDGSPCVDPTANDPGDTVTFNTTARAGNILLMRIDTKTAASGMTIENVIDSGTAQFIQYSVPSPGTVPVSRFPLAQNLDPGTCSVSLDRLPNPLTGTPPPTGTGTQQITFLDAGPVLNIANSSGTMQLREAGTGSYSRSLGSYTIIPGVPPIGSVFLDPDAYTADNGGGGADVPSFTGNLNVPSPGLKFVNIDAINNVTRSQGVTVQWSGGDPNGYVTVVGSVTNVGTTPGSVTLTANFGCSAAVSDGQLTVPSWVTMSLVANTGPAVTATSLGTLSITTYSTNRLQIPTLDLAVITYQIILGKGLTYQ
ncbi:MAG TPA: hypothetical protein VEV17_16315 [Bryobacteraceae bacterium]|nr:hypothetical protein [Bryobacteraceae bacterium]